MKKLLAVICILLIIFFSIYIYKTSANQNNVTAQEVEKIEEYISKIYLWKEVAGESLPKFDNINDAPDLWIWEVVKKNLENYELSYDEIQEKANAIFGNDFKKQFPKEGTDYIYYSEEYDKYIASGMGLDTLDDLFMIKKIDKTNIGYEVEIVEYLEDYSNMMIDELEGLSENSEEILYDIYIKNLNEKTIATIKSNDSESNTIEIVKENIDKFTTKTINLKIDENENIFVESVK